MEEEPGIGVVMAQPHASHTDPSPSSSRAAEAAPAAAAAGPDRRLRFYVELKPGETTIVSWKKLLKGAREPAGAAAAAPPVGAHPALESRLAPAAAASAADHQNPDGEPMDSQEPPPPPPANRFSAVIEKIERLYMGKDSSEDEGELADVPDDDEYDTEDSFIDDAELNDYFQVDKSATKHQGFFVNKGKLERIELNQPSTLAPKKRRRKEPVKLPHEKDVHHMPNDFVSRGSVRMKDAARRAPLIGKRSCVASSVSSIDRGCNDGGGKYVADKSSNLMDRSKNKREASPMLDIQPTRFSKKNLNQSLDMIDLQKQNLGTSKSMELGNISKAVRETSDAMNGQMDVTSVSSMEENSSIAMRKSLQKEKNGIVELPDLNYPGTTYPAQSAGNDLQLKVTTTMRPKGSTLDRAINDLEKSVANSKTSKLVFREGDASQVVRKRLPVEVKQKLAKVARLANSKGKITSQQFLDRLMGILGHLVQPATLKRHLKEMVEVGLTVKQAKINKFQQIKKEVSEMIKVRLNSSVLKVDGQQTGSEDFQDPLNNERKALAKFGIDEAVEDKICALYDLYVEGMDEDIGPQSRKLYVELAELWPAGYMDAVGIKVAIRRARKRRTDAYKQSKLKYEEGIKRQKLSSADKSDVVLKSSSQVRTGPDRLAIGSSG